MLNIILWLLLFLGSEFMAIIYFTANKEMYTLTALLVSFLCLLETYEVTIEFIVKN